VGRDDEEYTAFVVARYRSLVRAAVLLGCRQEDAEDAAQNALARCYVAWPRIRTADDPDAYVYRILVNGVFRGWRRKWRGEVPHGEVPERPADSDPALVVPVRESVRASLARLSSQHRQVVVLRYFADLTERQTAAVLGIAPGTVKSRASRAIALLAKDPLLASLAPAYQEEQP
jgi:RNA polymerase sigma-70 factor (sigma-E family)